MFVRAVKIASRFTRPIHSIFRNYGSENVHPGAATLFFINSDGWAITCAHVARQIEITRKFNNKYKRFKEEVESIESSKKRKRFIRELERKYSYSRTTTVEIKHRFINCIQGNLDVKTIFHQGLDLALLKFDRFTRLLCDSFPIFPADTSGLKQGMSLCRLGFPFPEFTNFTYDKSCDTIKWTQAGKTITPQFPIEGMVTRRLSGNNGEIVGFEMSTPGLRGQSGGPAFDVDGKVWGMQSATNHLDLNFDVDQEVIRKGNKTRVRDHAFLHVGHCVHVEVIKAFLKENSVRFIES